MTDYAILLTGDENRWANATAEERAATFARHDAFTVALGERGHTVTGGAELEHSRGAKVVRGTRGAVSVTDGPYAGGGRGAAGRLLPGEHRRPRRPARRLRHPRRRRRRDRGAASASRRPRTRPDAVPPAHRVRRLDLAGVDGGATAGVRRRAPRLRAGGVRARSSSSRATLWPAPTGASRCGTPVTGGSAPKDRSRGGPPAAGETAEQIGGFYLIDVTDERAAQKAAQCLPRQYTVEVRPVDRDRRLRAQRPAGRRPVRVAASRVGA